MATKYKQSTEKPKKLAKDVVGTYTTNMHLQIVEAIFDGKVLHPNTPLLLKPNTLVRITIETVKKKRTKTKSFLDVLESAKLKGPRDFSENLDDYLYRGKPINVNEG
jgi:predicted DNA-binding antitoxin AbrB/MazE fold protein